MILTDAAAAKVASLIAHEQIALPNNPLFLRIGVQPGGCSGLRYETYFDYETKDGDVIYNFDGFDLRLDRLSDPYLQGSTLDFVDTIEKQGFTLDNPNAEGSCACGDSFH
jgi:iron-sulfur cluster assembly accessory protein